MKEGIGEEKGAVENYKVKMERDEDNCQRESRS